MGSGSLALLYFLLGFHGGRQGSGPDRGQSPVEWGDFSYIRTYIRPSPLWAIQPDLRPSQPGLRPSQPVRSQAAGLAGCASGMAGWPRGRNKQTDRQTHGLITSLLELLIKAKNNLKPLEYVLLCLT